MNKHFEPEGIPQDTQADAGAPEAALPATDRRVGIRRRAAYYYGGQPVYGGGAGYGYGGMAAGYNMPYYGSGGEGGGDGDSVLGSLTFQRVLRVVMQKWPTLVVAVLLGVGAGFAYYKTAPVVYKSFAIFEMNMMGTTIFDQRSYGGGQTPGPMDEIFNTRLAKLRSREVIQMVSERVRADFPNLGLNDDEMYQMLYDNVAIVLQRRSRLVEISARHTRPEVARAISDAYAVTAEKYATDENAAQSDAGVAFLESSLAAQRALVRKTDEAILQFREANQIDVMESKKQAIDLVLQQLNSDLARAEGEESRAAQLLNVLTQIQSDPGKVSSLPEYVPRAVEIAQAQQAMQNALAERDALLLRYTDKHPEVIAKQNEAEVRRKQYLDAIWRARETAAANLDLIGRQATALREKRSLNEQASSELDLKIIAARVRLDQLVREQEVSEQGLQSLLKRVEQARLASEEVTATVRIVEKAFLPRRPISPDPRVAFTSGPALGLLVGFLFILLLDRLEDRITGASDIEQHMSTKVLCLVPHVPRAKREDLVAMSATKKFSRLAESFAGLRGLLESPRYRDLSGVILVVSTQPEEGKTITSSNLAATYALAGKKTLLVDFDLRRPRIARVFKVKDKNPASLVDVLAAGDPSGFDTLPIASGIENLDLVTSRSSAHISPASVMGSGIVPRFFEWARSRYDHVMIDSPPYGLISDAVVLGTLSDSVMLVCRPDRSRYRAMRHAIRQFIESGARVLGVVVNDVDFGRSSYFSNYDYRNYGYRYGYRYGRYGRYGGYYKRNIEADRGGEAVEDEDGESTVQPTSILDVDDEE